jgi:hypothetical protein
MFIEEWAGARIPQRVIDDASSWIAKFDDENTQPEDYQELNEWLMSDAKHRQAFEELSLLWAQSSVIKTMADRIERSQVIQLPQNIKGMGATSQPNNGILNCSENVGYAQVSPPLLWTVIATISVGFLSLFF